MSSELERIATLESRIQRVEADLAGINTKLDQLLAFRNKGAGVFWLVSALSGTGMIGMITWLIDSVRTH